MAYFSLGSGGKSHYLRAKTDLLWGALRQHCRSLGEGGGEGGPSAPNHLPPRRAGSTRSRTAPLEVDRSSSQSALSERSGRWNGRVWWTCVLASDRDYKHCYTSTTNSDRQLATPGRGIFLVSRHAVHARPFRNPPSPIFLPRFSLGAVSLGGCPPGS